MVYAVTVRSVTVTGPVRSSCSTTAATRLDVPPDGLGAQRADRAPLARPDRERVVPEEAHRVLVRDRVDLRVGEVGRVELLHHPLGRVRPVRVGVRVVDLDGDAVHADVARELHADGVGDVAEHDVLHEHLARHLRAEVRAGPRLVHAVRVVEALEEVGDPPDATLGQRDGEVGELLEHRRVDEVGRALHDVHRLEHDHHVDRRVDRGHHELARRADVHADDRPVVRARLPDRVPVIGVQARQAERLGVLRERDRVATLLRHPPDLGRARLRVPDHRDRERDEALGRVPAPLVDVPVVVRLREDDRRCPCPRARRRGGPRSRAGSGS